MKHAHLPERDDLEEEPDEPGDAEAHAPRAAPGDVRHSGVRLRGERAPADGDGGLPNGGLPNGALTNQGRCHSIEDICAHYWRYIWSRIQRRGIDDSDAADIFQKVVLAMQKRAREQGVPADVAPVLLVMIANQICNHLRAEARYAHRIDGEVDADTIPSSKPDPEQLVGAAEDRGEAREKVEVVLSRMSPKASRVFRLIEIDGLSHAEAGALTGYSADTVAVQIHRARARFWDLAARIYKVRGAT